ncbi:MAG: glycosyltransferase family 4 protein [Candidatus Binataceae bacterium]
MNLAHIDRQRGWTGQTRQTLANVAGLAARGITTILIAHRGSRLAEFAAARGLAVCEIPLYGGALFRAIVPLRRFLRRRGVEILHCHGPRDHLLAVLLQSLGAVPHVVRTRHNHNRIKSAMSRLLYARCSAVVSVSAWVENLAREDRIPMRRSAVIADAVDSDEFSPGPRDPALGAELGITPGALVVGHVSSLTPRKGVDVLLRAFAGLRARSPEGPMQLVAVGKNRERWMPLVRQLELESCVCFPGHRADIPHLLRLFDVFVMPSREEAMASAIVEAMSTGVPVVGSDAGGIPEAIGTRCAQDEGAGAIFPAGDHESLTRVLARYLESAELRRTAGMAGRRRALALFSLPAQSEALRSLYADILNEPRASQAEPGDAVQEQHG